ncbi:PREDICTED: uncharacterized protein LOC102006768 [Chinchilla lanigera]|uniref:uncharacterized protein LOC102006768 n=1 Tax=Chinchilla lanigera TaxID=34839 RepID=UPI000695B19B|nr:PREDICTED: uncharacterized protein LOC102006768 [Chinchilla lanigera]
MHTFDMIPEASLKNPEFCSSYLWKLVDQKMENQEKTAPFIAAPNENIAKSSRIPRGTPGAAAGLGLRKAVFLSVLCALRAARPPAEPGSHSSPGQPARGRKCRAWPRGGAPASGTAPRSARGKLPPNSCLGKGCPWARQLGPLSREPRSPSSPLAAPSPGAKVRIVHIPRPRPPHPRAKANPESGLVGVRKGDRSGQVDEAWRQPLTPSPRSWCCWLGMGRPWMGRRWSGPRGHTWNPATRLYRSSRIPKEKICECCERQVMFSHQTRTAIRHAREASSNISSSCWSSQTLVIHTRRTWPGSHFCASLSPRMRIHHSPCPDQKPEATWDKLSRRHATANPHTSVSHYEPLRA